MILSCDSHKQFSHAPLALLPFRAYRETVAGWSVRTSKTATMKTEQKRFWKCVEIQENGCWNWTRGKDWKGYGKFWLARKPGQNHSTGIAAHRWAYGQIFGEIPKTMQVHHTCKNKACVNQLHLQLLTAKEHTYADAKSVAYFNSLKTFCPSGHPYSPENTIARKGSRRCKICYWIQHQRTPAQNASRRIAYTDKRLAREARAEMSS